MRERERENEREMIETGGSNPSPPVYFIRPPIPE